MPEYTCECGKWFEVPYLKRKQVLRGLEVFCSPKCLPDYLLQFKREKAADPRCLPCVSDCVLSEPFEYWDKWTRQFYRSKSEAIAANFFLAHNIEIVYECFMIHIDKSSKTYNPDFFLPYYNTFIEVKGLWLGSSKKKVTCVNGMGIRVVVVPDYLIKMMEKEIREAKLF